MQESEREQFNMREHSPSIDEENPGNSERSRYSDRSMRFRDTTLTFNGDPFEPIDNSLQLKMKNFE